MPTGFGVSNSFYRENQSPGFLPLTGKRRNKLRYYITCLQVQYPNVTPALKDLRKLAVRMVRVRPRLGLLKLS